MCWRDDFCRRHLSLGLTTQDQLDFLRALGCRQGQGFLFSPAIPASEIAAELKRERVSPSSSDAA